MPEPITPAERYHILAGILRHAKQRMHEISDESLANPMADLQFVRESIADACAAIDAAVADVPTQEEIAERCS